MKRLHRKFIVWGCSGTVKRFLLFLAINCLLHGAAIALALGFFFWMIDKIVP